MPNARILPQLDLTDELVVLSLFIKNHEIDFARMYLGHKMLRQV
jgi:hypothetical protein